MKRSAAIAMMLLSPGLMLVALAMCCAFMSHGECHTTQSHCHEEQTAVSGSCCAVFEGGPAAATLHSAQFTLVAPDGMTTPAPLAQPDSTVAMAAAVPTLLDASPPVLSLRI